MPCCPSCACIGADPPVECLYSLDPIRFAHVKPWCEHGEGLWRRHSLGRSRLGPDFNPYIPPAPVAPQGDGDCPESSPAHPANLPVAEQLANIAQVKACASWQPTSGCGCGMNRCLAGKGREPDNAVSYNDCFECLAIGPYKKADAAP